MSNTFGRIPAFEHSKRLILLSVMKQASAVPENDCSIEALIHQHPTICNKLGGSLYRL